MTRGMLSNSPPCLLLQPLQCRDTVVLAQGWFVGLGLGGVQRNYLGIFLRLDSIETIGGMFHSFGQIIKRVNIYAVYLQNREISKIFVTNSSIHGKNLAENDNPTMPFGKQFLLKTVEINEPLGRVLHPVRPPFSQILPG
jgi:hypothetical protein